MTTPKLSMPELSVGQAGKELTHNQALAILDQLAQAVVVDKDLATPPVSPANGAMYIVAAGATGAWAGQSGKLAFWLTTVAAWTFITPANGWSVWVTDEALRYERAGGAWIAAAGGFAYSRSNILGPVSESAGVPTGAIFETGTNANGTYTKYACGKLVCLQQNGASLDASTAAGNVFVSSIAGSWTFPAVFVGSNPITQAKSIIASTRWGQSYSASLTSVSFTLISAVNTAVAQVTELRAEGRWFV